MSGSFDRAVDELLETKEGRTSVARSFSMSSKDWAIVEASRKLLVWYKTPPWSSSRYDANDIAAVLAAMQKRFSLPEWLQGTEAVSSVLLGSFEVESSEEYPGCLVVFSAQEFSHASPTLTNDAPRIVAVQFFLEPPPGWPAKSFVSSSLPKDFIENADKELKLAGELLSYTSKQQFLELEPIERLENNERQAFFSTRAKSKNWSVYYGTGASGARYSILVDLRG